MIGKIHCFDSMNEKSQITKQKLYYEEREKEHPES
jgi:hypothetical protein